MKNTFSVTWKLPCGRTILPAHGDHMPGSSTYSLIRDGWKSLKESEIYPLQKLRMIEWRHGPSTFRVDDPGSIVLPHGNFQVTEKLFFISFQPSQSALNVKYARAWVKLLSLNIKQYLAED